MSFAEKLKKRIWKELLRARLRVKDITIVSNNCWGAHIYQAVGRPYQTPFVGLFLAPACYIKLVSKFRWYLDQPIHFVRESRHSYINSMREERRLQFPIGCLGDEVELQFLHYNSEAEAAAAWNRRVSRVAADDTSLFFKFDDRDGCTFDQLATFDAAPVAHKVCFVSRPSLALRNAVWVRCAQGDQVPDGLQLSRISSRYFDTIGWINGADGRPRWWQPITV